MKKTRFAFGVSAMICIGIASFESHAVNSTYTLGADISGTSTPWSHFYEYSVGTCHPLTVLSDAYDNRSIRAALRRGHNECGFTHMRGHNVLIDAKIDTVVTTGAPSYYWKTLDSIYDSALACGVKPICELSGMPPALASGTASGFWYRGRGLNQTPPSSYPKWQDLITAFIQHLETRYGAEDVRNNWSFELWNEPNLVGSMPLATYLQLYDYTSQGVMLADSLVKLGGPAVSGDGIKGWLGPFANHVVHGTNAATGKIGAKCDFITYHRYPNDQAIPPVVSQDCNPSALAIFHTSVWDTVRAHGFAGQLCCTEWAPSFLTGTLHDDESEASFIAKTIHLLTLNNLTQYPLPLAYSPWCISDIFEEWNAWSNGTNRTFTGAYGLCLMGDKSYLPSYDLPKAGFNAFKLLHKLGTTCVPVTGGTTGNGVNAIATVAADAHSVQILLYNHTNGGTAIGTGTTSDSVALSVTNLPFVPGSMTVQSFTVDRTHSNCYEVWLGMGSPKVPTNPQWDTLKAHSNLDSQVTTTLTNKTFTKNFRLATFGVVLINLTQMGTGVNQEQKTGRVNSTSLPSISREASSILVYLPDSRSKVLKIFDLHGKLVFEQDYARQGNFRIDSRRLGKGVFVLSDNNGTLPKINPLIISK